MTVLLDTNALLWTITNPRRLTAAGALDEVHRDPFARLLAAQSIVEQIPIVTNHREFARLGAQVLW